MGGLFSKKRKDPQPSSDNRVTNHDLAVLELKKMRDRLKQYQRRVETQLEREKTVARQLIKDGKKEKAKLLLKKKRYMEQCLTNSDQQIENLEIMTNELEFSEIQSQLMEGMKIGNDALKKIHQVMSLEEVERILDETQDSIEYQRDIDNLLAGSFTQEDEDEVLKELNELTTVKLPDVPTDELPEREREKDRAEAQPSPKRTKTGPQRTAQLAT